MTKRAVLVGTYTAAAEHSWDPYRLRHTSRTRMCAAPRDYTARDRLRHIAQRGHSAAHAAFLHNQRERSSLTHYGWMLSFAGDVLPHCHLRVASLTA